MSTPSRPGRKAKGTQNNAGRNWAIVGGAVLAAGVIAIIVAAIAGGAGSPTPSADPHPTATTTPPATPSPEPSEDTPPSDVVDPEAAQRGWVPEPITRDEDVYVRAALTAAATFDTTLSTRDEWVDYLETWFTPDTRYSTEADRQRQLDQALIELRNSVLLPEETWDSLADESGRVEARVDGDVAYSPVPENPAGDQFIGEADVVMTFTTGTAPGSTDEVTYEEQVRIRVQVMCGGESIPTPNSPQTAGDCKVIRFFGTSES